ncbi:hypothetical protein EVAR_343_1 [Eumeta japonica]|uniref:Ig-like domain-containing protein n=1 Tax=Eumeta variegata TaxID=151549 RepID=A0A4C1S9Y9_EUMVA|nr:hypothetical protein EVAR_343_1 [Eumeta japonica]
MGFFCYGIENRTEIGIMVNTVIDRYKRCQNSFYIHAVVAAVVWQDWSVRVTSARAEVGGPALLTCNVPASAREHSAVAAWYRDDAVLVPSPDDKWESNRLSDNFTVAIQPIHCLYHLKEYECGLRMDELSVKFLLYADDQVILAPSTCEL